MFFEKKGEEWRRRDEKFFKTRVLQDKEFFKTINRAYQILTNVAARKAYNIFGLDKAETVVNNQN